MSVKRHVRWDRVIGCFLFLIGIVITSWVTASYVDVVTHNTDLEPTYQEWNAFVHIVNS